MTLTNDDRGDLLGVLMSSDYAGEAGIIRAVVTPAVESIVARRDARSLDLDSPDLREALEHALTGVGTHKGDLTRIVLDTLREHTEQR